MRKVAKKMCNTTDTIMDNPTSQAVSSSLDREKAGVGSSSKKKGWRLASKRIFLTYPGIPKQTVDEIWDYLETDTTSAR